MTCVAIEGPELALWLRGAIFGVTRRLNPFRSEYVIPTTTIGNVTVGRLAIGGNPLSGISHQNRERDIEMRDYFTTARIKETLAECERNGITALFGRADNHVMRTLAEYWNDGGKIAWFAQTAPERRSLLDNIRQAAGNGASGIYIHGGTAKDFRDSEDWSGMGEAVELIRSLGLPAGSATHESDFHAARRRSGVDVDFCLQCMYNIGGRRGKIDADDSGEHFYDDDRQPALDALASSPEPVFAYKILAAGRKSFSEALSDVATSLQPKDGVIVGMCPDSDPDMIAQNARDVAACLAE